METRSRGLQLNRMTAGRGQTLVEFALGLLIFLLLIMGIFDFGRAVYEQHTLANAAREGARQAIIATHTDAQIRQQVLDMAVGTGLTGPEVTITPSGSRTRGNPVTVGVSHVFEPITPLIAVFFGEDGRIILTASSKMDVEY